MDIKPGVFTKVNIDVKQVLEFEKLHEWKIFQVDCSEADDRGALFRCLCKTLPMDPEIHSAKSWDALSDSLWSGLHGIESEKILILMNGSVALENTLPDEYFEIKDVFFGIVKTLLSLEYTGGHKKYVSVFFI